MTSFHNAGENACKIVNRNLRSIAYAIRNARLYCETEEDYGLDRHCVFPVTDLLLLDFFTRLFVGKCSRPPTLVYARGIRVGSVLLEEFSTADKVQ